MHLGDAAAERRVVVIFEAMFARNSIWPSLERVTSDSSSPPCMTLKRGSRMPSLPPMFSRSFFQLLP